MSNIMQISMKAIISYTHLSWKLTAYGLKTQTHSTGFKELDLVNSEEHDLVNQ